MEFPCKDEFNTRPTGSLKRFVKRPSGSRTDERYPFESYDRLIVRSPCATACSRPLSSYVIASGNTPGESISETRPSPSSTEVAERPVGVVLVIVLPPRS